MKKKEIFKNIPNLLTISRIFLTIAIIILLIIETNNDPIIYTIKSIFTKKKYSFVSLNKLCAGCLFILACFTDYLDGYFAKKNNWSTNFGKFLDPIADKILVNSVLICFSYLKIIPIWITIINIIRDFILDGMRMFLAKKQIVLSANFYGKIKTILQMTGIIFIFFFFANVQGNECLMYWLVQNFLILFATFFSIISLFIYMKCSYHLLTKNPTIVNNGSNSVIHE